MAENNKSNQNRLIERLILGFVVIAVGLLIIQVGMNVMDTVDQINSNTGSTVLVEQATSVPATATPAGPTPTFDISSVDVEEP